MKDGLIERITSRAFWRIHFQPIIETAPLTLIECLTHVEQSNISLRGWDYPHITRRNDDVGQFSRMSDYIESWTDWQDQHEFWRMWKSSQFLHYRTAKEDYSGYGPRRPDGPVLEVTSTIFLISEVFEFLFRLRRSGLYAGGVSVNVALRNSGRRQLWIADPMRMGFFDPKLSDATDIFTKVEVGETCFQKPSTETSSLVITELFSHFGWTPSADHIASDQEKLFSRRLY